jgi:hypothetical protein
MLVGMVFRIGPGLALITDCAIDVPSKPPNQHTASNTALQTSRPAASSHDSKRFDIEASSPVPISARREYSSVLKLKLKTTTSGNCRAAGTCDLRGGVDLTGVKADDGEIGGEAAERRVVVLAGVGNLGGGVLTTFALEVLLETDGDLAGRAMAADGDGEDGSSICGTLRKMALTRIRNMNDWREEGAEWSGPASSFSAHQQVAWGRFVLFCQL